MARLPAMISMAAGINPGKVNGIGYVLKLSKRVRWSDHHLFDTFKSFSGINIFP